MADSRATGAADSVATRLELPLVWSIHESLDVAVWWATAYGSGSAHPYARDRAEDALRRAGALVFAADATRRELPAN